MLTRRSVEVSEQIAIEATRAHLEERAPLLIFDLATPEWPPRRAAPSVGATGPMITGNEALRLPRDATLRVEVAMGVLVQNASQRPVRLRLHPPLTVAGATTPGEATHDRVPPSEHVRVAANAPIEKTVQHGEWLVLRLAADLPLTKWLEGADEIVTPRERRLGKTIARLGNLRISRVDIGLVSIEIAPPVVAETAPRTEASASYARVTGVVEVVSFDDATTIDHYLIEVSGAPFEPIPDQHGGVHLRGVPLLAWGGENDPLRGSVSQRREYWLSRQRGVRLPDRS